MGIEEVEPTKSHPDLVTGVDTLEKVGRAEAESQVSRWWCHWLRRGGGGRAWGDRNPDSVVPKPALHPNVLQIPGSAFHREESGLGTGPGLLRSPDGSEETARVGCGCLEGPSIHAAGSTPTKSREVPLPPGSSPTRLRAAQAFVLPPTRGVTPGPSGSPEHWLPGFSKWILIEPGVYVLPPSSCVLRASIPWMLSPS